MSTPNAAPAPTATPSIPASDSPTGVAIPTINAASNKPSAIEAPKPAAPERPAPKILSVREALGIDRREDPDAKRTKAAIEAKERPRNPDGTFVKTPKTKAKPKADSKPEGTAPAPQAAAPTATQPQASPDLPPPVNRIKVGDREMTEAEVAEHIAKLEAKANSTATPPEPKTPEATNPPEQKPQDETPEARTAREQQESDAFLAEHAATYTPSQEDFDTMLATGNPELLGKLIARAAMDARKFLASSVNPVIARLNERIAPVLTQQEQIAQYQAEAQFLAIPDHKDIASHPDAHSAIREAGKLLHQHYDQLQRLIASGAATEDERRSAAALENPEQWNADVAYHARRALAQKPVAPPAEAPAPTTEPPKPRPQPPGGQAVGGGGVTTPVSTQSAVMKRIAAYR